MSPPFWSPLLPRPPMGSPLLPSHRQYSPQIPSVLGPLRHSHSFAELSHPALNTIYIQIIHKQGNPIFKPDFSHETNSSTHMHTPHATINMVCPNPNFSLPIPSLLFSLSSILSTAPAKNPAIVPESSFFHNAQSKVKANPTDSTLKIYLETDEQSKYQNWKIGGKR